MERFSYPSLEAMRAESGEMLRLLECEHWGRGMDQEEMEAEQRAQIESQRSQMG